MRMRFFFGPLVPSLLAGLLFSALAVSAESSVRSASGAIDRILALAREARSA